MTKKTGTILNKFAKNKTKQNKNKKQILDMHVSGNVIHIQAIIHFFSYYYCYFSDRLDENEQMVRFTFNNHVRDSVMLVSPEKAVQLYEAYLTIGRMLRDPANQIEHKMVPGDVITFNNSRVLHGRSSFTITEESKRYLQGFYLDWDTIYSRMRVLAKRFNIPFGI